jgi:hypothetical protein
MTPRRRLPLWGLVLVGLGAGVVLGLAALVLTGRDGPGTLTLTPAEPGVPAAHQDDARAFIAAWQRYRMGTFVLEPAFERRFADGRSLTATRLMVQRPPWRVVRQLGGTSATGGTQSVSCDEVDDRTVCTPGPGRPYDEQVAEELLAWATAFAGSDPVYVVEAPQAGCYELRLNRAIPSPPYGNVARFCFDEATGALRARQVVRDDATDTEEATRLSATVTDADLAAAGG